MKLGRELLSFGVVGVIGYAVDVTVLYLLAPLMGPYAARVVSFLAAATTTWAFNRRYTFAARVSAGGSIWREYLGYLVTMSAGAVLNYGAYALTLHWIEGRGALAIAVAVGSLAGMTVNFLSARYLIFRSKPDA
jgi:putative flippase GtrA